MEDTKSTTSTLLYLLAVVVVISSIVLAVQTREELLYFNERIAPYIDEEPESMFAIYEIILKGVVVAAFISAFGKLIDHIHRIRERLNRNDKGNETA